MKSKVLALILLCGAASLGAKVKLPALVGDNMILQQQTEVKLWGTAAPEAEVRVTPSWNGQTMTCRADKDGGWTLAVETPAAGYTPYEITFDDGEKTTLKNILIGEVWLASGQSNMEMPLKGFAGCCIMNGADDIIVSAENKGVRMFTVPKHQTYELQTDCKGSWNISSIETAPDFSATAYYFATSLSRALRIPVGIICSAYGGSTVEGWISRELLENYPDISLNPDSIERLHPMLRPMLMYNAMLKPLQNYTIKGFIWYQGEANVSQEALYPTLQAAMVEDWRIRWRQGYLPFLYVQLANFQPRPDAPVRYDAWAAFRDAQTGALSGIPHSGMACTIDIGDAEDIHPRNKQDVAHRLYRIARARVYAPESGTVCSGPVFDGLSVEGNRIRIRFRNASGLCGIGVSPSLEGFAVEDRGGRLHRAGARIEEGKVVVELPEGVDPVRIQLSLIHISEPTRH